MASRGWLCLALVAFLGYSHAQAQAINYNTTSNTLQFYDGTSWLDFGTGTTVAGACSPAGKFEYDTTAGVWKYCTTGNVGRSFSAQVTATACSPAGRLEYTGSMYRFCNSGSVWVNVVAAPTNGYFVLSSTTYRGDIGSLAAANTACLTELSTGSDWNGKTDAQSRGILIAGKVRAFLCDNSTCNQATSGVTYKFATVGSAGSGGASFTANIVGSGPEDAANWSGATYFNTTNTYWTGRSVGTATSWPSAGSGVNCSGWTTQASNGSATTGAPSSTSFTRWSFNTAGCDTPLRLVCMVNP